MSVLGGVAGKEAVRKFVRLGYAVVRQRGSHVRLRHDSDPHRLPLTIPLHGEIKKGLLRQLIKDAGISVEEFVEL